MDYVCCDACNGRKRVVGLGSFERDCAICKGVGYVEQAKITPSKIISSAIEILDQTIPSNDLIPTQEERKAELDALIEQAAKEEKKRKIKVKKKPKKKSTTTRSRTKDLD